MVLPRRQRQYELSRDDRQDQRRPHRDRLRPVTITAQVRGGDTVDFCQTGKDDRKILGSPETDAVKETCYLITDTLGEIWRGLQKPRTSPGGPSSPGRGGDDYAETGDPVVYEPSDEDDD